MLSDFDKNYLKFKELMAKTNLKQVPPKKEFLEHPLCSVFGQALYQAKNGKGAERHGTSDDFEDQPIVHIGRLFGPRGPAFQVAKKLHEAIYCYEKGTFTKKQAYEEILGSLVYLATIAKEFQE